MTPEQYVAIGALVTITLVCLGAMVWMTATSMCRDHYRRAGVRFDDHVDEALEVTR